MKFDWKSLTLSFSITNNFTEKCKALVEKYSFAAVIAILSTLSIGAFIYYLQNGLGVSYNDARSHLDIARRVVENLQPGFAQLGSVWLPLPHILMLLTVWNDFMWHTGLAGALQSMVSYVATGAFIYLFLKKLGANIWGQLIGVLVFAMNLNVLYMQSTAMTELLLLGTMTAGTYELIQWHRDESVFRLVKTAFWIMLSTLIRYDGWFLFLFAIALILFNSLRKHGYKTAEGVLVLFCTLGGFGIFLWLVWNQMIFKDALYFITGPYSAGTQQEQLAKAGVLATKHNLPFSLQTYFYALVYNSGLFNVILAAIGALVLWFDKNIAPNIRIATLALLAPFFFNVLALYAGQSVIFVQGLHGNSWFNVRYGLMMLPSIAVFAGYLAYRAKPLRLAIISLILFVSFFGYVNNDAVTIDDARLGASGKNVSEVSGWLHQNAGDKDGFVLISVASHDAIIFSSGLPMKKYIHEGTGKYWDDATQHPSEWARWIIMRTNDTSDNTFKALQYNKEFKNDYTLVHSFPFADIYEIKPQFVSKLHTQPSLALK